MKPGPGLRSTRTAALLAALVSTLAACGGDAAGPSPLTTVTVTSPLDSILALGGSVQLEATGRNDQGDIVPGIAWTWSSSNPAAVSISPSGLATAAGVGTATVTASAEGASGRIGLRVVDADLTAVATVASDAFATALIGTLSSATSGTVQTAWSGIGTSAGTGHVQAIIDAIAVIRGAATSATDPTDRAALAVLALYAATVERYLGI